jgi:lipid-A-disaccharide synthase
VKIFFSVGEPSGDLHGANLIRELKRRSTDIECVGYGGPQMASAGCQLHADLTRYAVMWFSRVLLNLHRFYWLWRQAGRYFQVERPDAVVLIDYPGFNWWIARSAKRYGIPVYYYGVPQMWAWAGWRVKKMRKLVDHVLCKLAFEPEWFAQRGCRAKFVGHPYFDEVCQRRLDEGLVAKLRQGDPLVTILPGSRTQEVLANLPTFLRTAARVLQEMPHVRFAIASFNARQAELARKLVEVSHLAVEVHVGQTPELIEAAHCCLACSGSVSLELLYHEKPTVVLYKVRPFALFVQGFFRKVRYITLVNLLATHDLFPGKVELYDPDASGAESVPFPEYLTSGDKSVPMAKHILRWLTDARDRASRVMRLRALKERHAAPGASFAAAEYILQSLVPTPLSSHPRVPPPHFDTCRAA